MHGLWARERRNRRYREFLEEDREFDHFADDDESRYVNSADEVISEMGLALVVILGVVFAINMVLVAFHIG